MDILKVGFLTIAVFFTIAMIVKLRWENDDYMIWYMLIQTIGIVGFLTLQFNLL